jgi:hypothetical protein
MLSTLFNDKIRGALIDFSTQKDTTDNSQDSTNTQERENKEIVIKHNDDTGEYKRLYEDELNYDLSTLLESNNTQDYEINFVLMYVNDELKIPFGQYFFEKKDNEMVLPKVLINKSKIYDSSQKYTEESDYDSKHYIFIDNMKQKLKTNYNIEFDTVKYKGYIIYKSQIYVLLDTLQTLFEYGYMAIYDEFVYGNEIRECKVNDEILTFFKDNKNIQYFTDKDGNRLDVPLHGYLCKYENNELINVKEEESFEDMLDHNIFGMNYVFSEFLLDEDNDNKYIYKKYAVFINDVLLKTDDNTKLSPRIADIEDYKTYEENDDYEKYSSIYYHDGSSRTFVLVKNYDRFCPIE